MSDKLPKTIGTCCDHLWKLDQKIKDLNKQVKNLESQRAELKRHQLVLCNKQNATAGTGKLGRVEIRDKEVFQLEDPEAFYSYVKKTGSFELLQRRLGSAALKERYAHGDTVPGIKRETIREVAVLKAK